MVKSQFGLTKKQRVRSSRDFALVYQTKQFAADHALVINAKPNQSEQSRIGLSVSRKVGNAVCRNRWKRLIREAFRLQQQQLPSGWDWVVRPRKGAEPDLATISKSLRKLTNRLAKKGTSRSPSTAKRNSNSRKSNG